MTTGEAGQVPLRAKKAHEPQPEIAIVVTVHHDGNVELDGDDLHLSLWHHGPAWLQSVLGQAGHQACGSLSADMKNCPLADRKVPVSGQ